MLYKNMGIESDLRRKLVSVVVPIYNTEKYLIECIESILGQTYSNIEVILVDDGSTDGSPTICDNYAKKDDRVYVIHKKNGGRSDARNVGIKMAKGEYLLLIDSDDYCESNMISQMLECDIAECDIAVCRVRAVNSSGEELKVSKPLSDSKIIYDKYDMLHQLAMDNQPRYIVPFTKLYKMSLMKDIKFPYGKENEDEFVAHYIFGKCTKILIINEILYNYRIHDSSFTQQAISYKNFDGVEALLDRVEYFLNQSLNKEAAKIYCEAFGRYYYLTTKLTDDELSRKRAKGELWTKLKTLLFRVPLCSQGVKEVLKVYIRVIFLSITLSRGCRRRL